MKRTETVEIQYTAAELRALLGVPAEATLYAAAEVGLQYGQLSAAAQAQQSIPLQMCAPGTPMAFLRVVFKKPEET